MFYRRTRYEGEHPPHAGALLDRHLSSPACDERGREHPCVFKMCGHQDHIRCLTCADTRIQCLEHVLTPVPCAYEPGLMYMSVPERRCIDGVPDRESGGCMAYLGIQVYHMVTITYVWTDSK